MQDRLLTIQDVSDRLGLTVETIYRWGQQGTLPRVQLLARTIRFRESRRRAVHHRPAAKGLTVPVVMTNPPATTGGLKQIPCRGLTCGFVFSGRPADLWVLGHEKREEGCAPDA